MIGACIAATQERTRFRRIKGYGSNGRILVEIWVADGGNRFIRRSSWVFNWSFYWNNSSIKKYR
jgi:hypothetical protein